MPLEPYKSTTVPRGWAMEGSGPSHGTKAVMSPRRPAAGGHAGAGGPGLRSLTCHGGGLQAGPLLEGVLVSGNPGGG